MSRPREDGIVIGTLEPGPRNSIADVGVTVGHVTVERTGVTPSSRPRSRFRPERPVLNGAGELTGSLEIREWGILETPVYLTSTHAVGRVYDGAVSVAMANDPRVGVDEVVIPVVGECDDSWLSDARVAHVQPGDVAQAVTDATADFEQGAVGAGAGMSCFDWKGGIGSSSRRAGDHTVGVLLLTNFGTGTNFASTACQSAACSTSARTRCQIRVAAALPSSQPTRRSAPPQLERLARRAGLGLARAGSVAHHGSGEIFVAFATGSERSFPDRELNPLFQAAVDATEEAVLCSLGRRSTRPGVRDGWCARCRGRRCSSSTAAAAGSRRTGEGRVPARRGPSPPRAG